MCASRRIAKNIKNHVLSWRSKVRPSAFDAVVQPVDEDPVEHDRVPAEAGAGSIPAPCQPSEIEKMKREFTHIPFQPWRTSCVEGKAPTEPQKRITEDSELSTVQCDYLVLNDVAACVGLKVLSMSLKSLGYGTPTVVETKGATDTFGVMW